MSKYTELQIAVKFQCSQWRDICVIERVKYLSVHSLQLSNVVSLFRLSHSEWYIHRIVQHTKMKYICRHIQYTTIYGHTVHNYLRTYSTQLFTDIPYTTIYGHTVHNYIQTYSTQLFTDIQATTTKTHRPQPLTDIQATTTHRHTGHNHSPTWHTIPPFTPHTKVYTWLDKPTRQYLNHEQQTYT